MNWYKKAKHISPHSQYCIYCKSNIIPRSFSRNSRHHFPWGILYKCDCGKSGLWSNSIRGGKEFLKHVFDDKPLSEFPYLEGFCNDLFCPFCFSNVQILKNGLLMDISDNPIIYIRDGKYFYLSNYDAYIRSYNTDKLNPTETTKNSIYLGKSANIDDVVKSVDIEGCDTLKHNIGIIRKGYDEEYGEGEYQPIYNWIKENKLKIPQEMIKELRYE